MVTLGWASPRRSGVGFLGKAVVMEKGGGLILAGDEKLAVISIKYKT